MDLLAKTDFESGSRSRALKTPPSIEYPVLGYVRGFHSIDVINLSERTLKSVKISFADLNFGFPFSMKADYEYTESLAFLAKSVSGDRLFHVLLSKDDPFEYQDVEKLAQWRVNLEELQDYEVSVVKSLQNIVQAFNLKQKDEFGFSRTGMLLQTKEQLIYVDRNTR